MIDSDRTPSARVRDYAKCRQRLEQVDQVELFPLQTDPPSRTDQSKGECFDWIRLRQELNIAVNTGDCSLRRRVRPVRKQERQVVEAVPGDAWRTGLLVEERQGESMLLFKLVIC